MYDIDLIDLIDRIFDAKEYPPTAEQRRLVETIAEALYSHRPKRRIIVCKAVAGAGKTATSLDVYNVLTTDLAGQFIQFVAFNVKAKDEMIARGVDPKHAKTLNGLGHANLSRYARNRGLKLDVQDGLKVINLLRQTDPDLAKIAPARRFAKKLIDFVKAHGLKTFDRTTLEGLADHYEAFIDLTYEECEDQYNMTLDTLESKTYDWVGQTMVANNRVPESGDWVIDFNDQVYLPVVLGIRCFENDLLVVDEAQDLSLANKRLVDRCLKKNGVLVLVGDDFQCIYAWRGCEVDGLSKTLARPLDVKASPLTYNWRSGKQIIEFAQTICPDIQCGNGKEAVVETKKIEDFDVLKLEGDTAVLSRLRAPLVSYAIELLKADKPFTFQFSLKFLIDTIKQIAESDLSIRAFKRRLAVYVDKKRELYQQQDADSALEDLEDFAAIMATILEKVTTTDKVADLIAYIKDLDRRIRESDGSLCLSTIHGSKGLEWETTYIIGYAEIGNRATKDWKVTEARNLRFVAATRAKTNLIFLKEEAK